ncbi:MAG: M23 family metallopeptidase [Clostridia bacterium]|nr:M23 family metallopeptidase [Clostridia bacterium]
MERTMSVEDKIRRAEEIYYKRREQQIPMRDVMKTTKEGKKDIKLFKKMIKQIIICIAIYGGFYTIINSNYIFSEDFTNKAKEILSQDINIKQIYSGISTKVMEIINNMKIEETNTEEPQLTPEEIQNNDENIGGAEAVLTEENLNTENNIPNEAIEENIPEKVEISQEEQDANYIKSTIKFIKPVNGVISSMYGERNPTTPTVPKQHTGTDIAAEVGTKIVSATDGTVILSSTKGDYGNHLQIQTNDVILVYAHCNKLYVKEGDTITQGQEIAEVGATGNVTGPHLHFEIRYQNRYINPQMILEL